MTPVRPDTEEATAIKQPAAESNEDGASSANGESPAPVLNARKLRKIRRMAEKKKLKEAEAEAKAKAKAERKAQAKAKFSKRRAKPMTKRKKINADDTQVTEASAETPAGAAEMNQEDQVERKTKKKKEKKSEKTGKPKKQEEESVASEEPQSENTEKEEKPWIVEKKKKEEEQKKQEERERLKNKQPWQIQKQILKEKFPEGWKPKKKMSPDAMAGIRALHRQFPDTYTTEVLAQKFEMSPEAIRRILKSKWEEKDETPDIDIQRQERWFKRGKSIWARYAAMGKKPPRKWRAEGVVRHPSWNIPRGQHSRRGGSVWALREAAEAKPEEEEDDPEKAAARREWLSKRQHRRNTQAKERKLLRQASDGLLKTFF